MTQQQNDEMRRLSEAGLAQNEETRRLSEVGLAQNEEVRKTSSGAAILFAPTLVGTIYGMNFDHMQELHWALRVSVGGVSYGADGVGVVGHPQAAESGCRAQAALMAAYPHIASTAIIQSVVHPDGEVM